MPLWWIPEEAAPRQAYDVRDHHSARIRVIALIKSTEVALATD
jgi:hypothetical protein